MFWRTKKKPEANSKKATPLPSSELWDLVLDMDWARVISHCKNHPINAQYIDGDWGETPLYLACQQNPPVEAVRAIIQSYPEALLISASSNRDLPLHLACRYRTTEYVIEELLKTYPQAAVKQTKFGAHALHVLWKFRPEGAEQDERFWKKVILILRAIATFKDGEMQSKENRDEHILHAAVSLKALSCPIEIFKFLVSRYPNQVFQRDSRGMLPLHVAVGPTAWSESTRRKYRPREQHFVSILLKLNPNAANEKLRSNHNRYPLHIALTNRHTWSGGIQFLLHAAPEVLLVPDPATRLCPFQLAAVPVGDTTVDLDTIFNLLKSRPDVLRSFNFDEKKKETRL